MKFHRNGQISVYLLLSIGIILILITIFSATLILKKSPVEDIDKLQKNSMTEEIFSSVNNCVANSGKSAVLFTMRHGGTFGIYQYVKEPFYSTSYHFFDGMNYAPTKIETELFINMFFLNSLQNCFVKINEKYPSAVEPNKIETTTTISNSSILFSANSPVTVHQKNTTFSESQFTYLLEEVYIENMLEVSQYLAKEQTRYGHSACISCSLDAQEKYNITIGMYEAKDNSIIFEVIDNRSYINSEPILYRFGHNYGAEYE